MTSLLLLKIINVLANFLILPDALLFQDFSLWRKFIIDWIEILQISLNVIMTSNCVIVSMKLFHDVGNDEYIIPCNFSGLILIWKPTFIEYFFNDTSTSPAKRIDLWMAKKRPSWVGHFVFLLIYFSFPVKSMIKDLTFIY